MECVLFEYVVKLSESEETCRERFKKCECEEACALQKCSRAEISIERLERERLQKKQAKSMCFTQVCGERRLDRDIFGSTSHEHMFYTSRKVVLLLRQYRREMHRNDT